MVSHPEVVWFHRFLDNESNRGALLVMGANLETNRQSRGGSVSHIMTGQQLEQIFEFYQTAIRRDEKLPLYQAMEETGLHPYNPGLLSKAANWFTTDRPRITVDTQGITKLPPMIDAGLTARVLKEMSLDLVSDIPVSELVPWLMDNFTLTLQPGHEIGVFQRVPTPDSEEDRISLNQFAYTHGISIAAWRYFKSV